MYPSQPIVFYDGLCGLCDKSVQFILEKDKHERFLFCALQSNYARKVLGHNISFDSFILYDNGKAYTKSTGALLTLKKLGGFWQLLYVFIIIPTFLRNAVYSYIAKNRYQWFGKFDSCKIPSQQQRMRFIE